MSFFGKLVKGALDVVLLPVDVVKDLATLGGAFTDQEAPYSVQRGQKIIEDVEGAGDDAAKGDWLSDD